MSLIPEPPELPDRYTPLGHLGEGATGIVWHARDEELGREVALKVARANLALHARFRARFAREVVLTASVQHPHVVPVLDLGQLRNGCPFVSLAHANRGSLREVLAQQAPLVELLRILDEVLDALAHLHALGFVHQDLKPENVLLHGEGQAHAWLADLGVAGDKVELAMARRGIAGTPRWMAPEQLGGKAQELGPWTDLYAVGLILRLALEGRAETARSVDHLLAQRVVPPQIDAPGAPPELLDLTCTLLDPDPRQRMDRAADVRRALGMIQARMDGERKVAIWSGERSPGSTTFPVPVMEEMLEPITARPGARTITLGAPRWNRVLPGELPSAPPDPDHVHGLASLSVFGHGMPPMDIRPDIRARLWEMAREVKTTHEPRVALIIGTPMSGKSQMVGEVSRALDAGGHMESFSLRYHSPPDVEDGYRGTVRELLAPWGETRGEAERRISRWLARDQQTTQDEVATEAAVLARWCGYLAEGEVPVNAAVGLAWLYRTLDARAWRGGAALVLEDVHASEVQGDGLAICEALLTRVVGERPLLVMATLSAEAVDEDPVLAARVAQLVEEGAEVLRMEAVPSELIEAWMCARVGLEPGLAAQVAPSCHGNPVFAAMLMRDWASRKSLVRGKGGGWSLPEGTDLLVAVPPNLDALCMSRLEGALAVGEDSGAPASRALAAVALAGQDPPSILIQTIAEEGLDILVASGLVHRRGWRLHFEHSALQRAALDMALERTDVVALNQALSSAWASLGMNTGLDVDRPVALHSLRAGDPEGAVRPALRASVRAMRQARPDLSEQAARLAVDSAHRSDNPVALVEAREHLARALLALGRPKDAQAQVDEALGTGRVDRLTRARLEVLSARSSLALGQTQESRRRLTAALPIFRAMRDRRGRVEIAQGLAMLARLEGAPDKAAKLYEEMIEVNGGKDARFEALGISGIVECRIAAGVTEGLGAWVKRLQVSARASGDTRNIAQSTYAGGLYALSLGQLDSAELHFQTGLALAATLGNDTMRLACHNNLGEVHRYRGNLDEAQRAYEQTARLAAARGWRAKAAIGYLNIMLIAMGRGEQVEASNALERAAGLLQEIPRHWAWSFVGLVRAAWAAEAGREVDCRRWWLLAQDRGLGRIVSPDLHSVFVRLTKAAIHEGWEDIASEAAQLASASAPKS